MKSTTKKTQVTINVLETEYNGAEENQKLHSIFMEFGKDNEIIAITGVTMQQRQYKEETDLVLNLRVVPQTNQDVTKVMNIRAFKRFDEKLGKEVAKSVAFKEATKLLLDAGVKITSIGGMEDRPNLKDYRWVSLGEPVVVVITPREVNGRFYPNRFHKYTPITIKEGENALTLI
jgi:hypothetical protein